MLDSTLIWKLAIAHVHFVQSDLQTIKKKIITSQSLHEKRIRSHLPTLEVDFGFPSSFNFICSLLHVKINYACDCFVSGSKCFLCPLPHLFTPPFCPTVVPLCIQRTKCLSTVWFSFDELRFECIFLIRSWFCRKLNRSVWRACTVFCFCWIAFWKYMCCNMLFLFELEMLKNSDDEKNKVFFFQGCICFRV